MKLPSWPLVAGIVVAGGAAAYGLSQVPMLQDGVKAKVERLGDPDADLLPAKSGQANSQRTGSAAEVERLSDADDDLLPVKPKGNHNPADDLLEPYPDQGTTRDDAAGPSKPRPIAAKAGRNPSPGVNASFNFDLTFGYHALMPDGQLITSYFFLDSRQGHVGVDRGAMAGVGHQTGSDGGQLDFSVMTNAADFYTYVRNAELGPMAMMMDGGLGTVGRDFESYMGGDMFENTFKPTGRVRTIGQGLSKQGYRSVEYSGIEPDSGIPIKVWLADPDFDVGFYAFSYMGLGVVPLPMAGVQKLITRLEGAGTTFELSYIRREQNNFSGASYKDMSALMKRYTRSIPAR